MKIIDAHVHIGSWPEFDLRFGMDNLRSVMKLYRYEGAVVVPALVGDPKKANEAILKQTIDYDDLYFFAWVQPPSDDLLPFLERRDVLIDGLKFHPSISQVTIEDRSMRPFLEYADRRRIPLLYHCGRNPMSFAEHVQIICDSYPNVKFLLAHVGGNAVDRIIRTAKLFASGLPSNVYVESSTARHPDLLQKVVDVYGDDHVIFGSDLPFTDMRMTWYCLELAGLTTNERFLSANILRLLKVPE